MSAKVNDAGFLTEIPEIQVQDIGVVQCGIESFSGKTKTPEGIVQALAEKNINVNVSRSASTLLDMEQRELDALVRAGLHFFNTDRDQL